MYYITEKKQKMTVYKDILPQNFLWLVWEKIIIFILLKKIEKNK